MSFRTKLVTFFVLVVIVPMGSVGFVLFNLIGDNETGKADARLASRQAVAVNLVRDLRERADAVALTVGEDPEVAAAIRARDEPVSSVVCAHCAAARAPSESRSSQSASRSRTPGRPTRCSRPSASS